jgi:uncharacterized protein (DUF1501 family)
MTMADPFSTATAACADGAALSRRHVLGAGVSFFAWAHAPKFARASAGRDPRLLVVILRGALDGLSAAPPIGDPDYAGLRGDIALPTTGELAVLPLDGFFALHPSLKTFSRLYREGKASVVHATATSYRERSHFDGQDMLESGYERVGRVDSGWLNRALQALPAGHRVTTKGGLGIGATTPLILRGSAPVMGWAPQSYPTAGDDLARRVLDLYTHADRDLAQALLAGLDTEKMAKRQGMVGDLARPQGGSAEPRGMVQAAQGAARLILADDGPRIAALSFDGWDTHANQGGATGRLATLLGGLDQSFGVFEKVLAPVWHDTAVVVITEFGRTARVNGTVGSDHGTGTVAFLLGGAIRGGKLFADWPGLKPNHLHDGRDLKPTTDLRAVLKGLLHGHLGLSESVLSEQVFPGTHRLRPLSDLTV